MHQTSSAQQAGRAGRREWIGLAAIALPCMVYSMDLTVLNLALPAISARLQPSSAQMLWIIDIYGFFVAGFLITMGTLGDRIGRRRLLLIGAALFALASMIAAFASTAQTLILARALLGIAGATVAPSTLALIRNMFHDAQQRQFALGIWIAAFSLGAVIGPFAGALLLEFFGWEAVFWVGVPVMGLLLAVGPAVLPEYRDPHAGSIDLPSVVSSLTGVLATVYAFKRMAEGGADVQAAAALALGVLAVAFFVLRQRRIAYPLLDLALFERAAFRAAIAAYSLSGLAMFGIYVFITQYLQSVLALTPMQAGIATVPWGLTFLVGSVLAPKLTRWMHPERILVAGLAVSTVGFVLVFIAAREQSLAILLAGTVVMSAGLAPVFTFGNELILTTAPPERAGAASALSETSSEFSGALGIALIGSLGTALYRTHLEAALPPALPAQTRDAALDTIGAAVAQAAPLPEPMRSGLLAASRGAFTEAVEAAALAGVVLMVLACVFCARLIAPGREAAAAVRGEAARAPDCPTMRQEIED